MQCPAGSGEGGAEVPQLRVPVAQSLQVLHVVRQVLGHEAHEVTGRAGRGVDIKIPPLGMTIPSPGAGRDSLPAVHLLLQLLVQLLRDVGAAGGGSAGTGRRVSPGSGILPVCGQSHQLSGTLPAPSSEQPPAPPRLTRVLLRPRAVHGVQQGGRQPVVWVLVGTDQVGKGAETLGLDALDGLGRQSRGSTVTSPPLPGQPSLLCPVCLSLTVCPW